MKISAFLWRIFNVSKSGDKVSKAEDIFILALIFLNITAVIIESVQSISQNHKTFFYYFEFVSVIIFSIEYVARLWGCVSDPEYRGQIKGRLKFAFDAMTLIDFLAIAPFYLPFLGLDLRSLRALRLLRVLRVVKIGRYYSSLNLIKQVLKNKKEELVLTSALMAMLLLVSSCLLFYCEKTAQPEAFSSIPATMWWSVATLTTVGYGDIYPVTSLGKVFASIIAMLGIGMFALPTGILGAGFVEAIEERKKKKESKICPHCKEEIE